MAAHEIDARLRFTVAKLVLAQLPLEISNAIEMRRWRNPGYDQRERIRQHLAVGVPAATLAAYDRSKTFMRTFASRSVGAMASRTRHANRRRRVSRSRRTTTRPATVGSRAGPHPAGDDDPPLASFRPHQGATAVARAFALAQERAA